MSDFKVYKGVEHLHLLNTCTQICFDTETLQLNPEEGKLRLLQFGDMARKTIVLIDLFETDEDGREEIRKFFETPRHSWIAHNAIFDLSWCSVYGWYPNAAFTYCTLLWSRLLTNGQPKMEHKLSAVAKRYLGIELDKEQQTSNWGGELSQEQLDYAAKDVEVLCQLSVKLLPTIQQERLKDAFDLECKALPALASMSVNGLPWDRTMLEEASVDYAKDVENLSRELHLQLDAALPEEHKLPRDPDGSLNLRPRDTGYVRDGTKKYAGFNIGSPKQFIPKLEALLGEVPTDPTTGKVSTSKDALKQYEGDHPVVAMYLQWKRQEKRRQMTNKFLQHLEPDGYIRASYWQLGTETGRMSCSDPNLQQVPKDSTFRAAVRAPEGWKILDADYSQMELRLAAIVADDIKMQQAFIDGKDLHTATSESLGCDRGIAKTANFSLLYGTGAKAFRNKAAASGIFMTEEEANRIRSGWLSEYSGIAQWHRDLSNKADSTQKKGFCEVLVPVSGLRRRLVGPNNKMTNHANTPVQGAGAAILKQTLNLLWKHIKGMEAEAKLAAAVHDELILLVREDVADKWAQILKECMEKAEAMWLGPVPAIADVNVADSWADAH